MSTLYLVVRLILALAFVGGLLWFLARAGNKGRLGFLLGNDVRGDLEITSQRPLGRTTSVAVVRAGDRHLLIGVSDHGITLLAEGDDLVGAGIDTVADELESRRGSRPDQVETIALRADELLAAGMGADPIAVLPVDSPAQNLQTAQNLPTTQDPQQSPDPQQTRQEAPKRLPAMFTPTQPRMTLIESLRELTVRKL